MRRLSAGVACLGVAGAILAGCGGSGGGGYGSAPKSSSTPASTSTAAPAPAQGATVQVTMMNTAFNPAQSTGKVGQTVKWTNQDGVPHNVTAVKGGSFKSKDLQPGQSYSYKLASAGTIQYVCTIHPNMTATLHVVK
jgi:plastocyanin